ncbi:MAG: iron ABC transporter permease, partial [Rhizobium sp.]
MTRGNRRLDIVLAFGAFALILLPWYRIEGGFYSFRWLSGFFSSASNAPGVLQILSYGKPWLVGIVIFFLAACLVRPIRDPMRRGGLLAFIGAAGLVFLALQGLAIGFTGWAWTISENLFGMLADGQPSMGAGAVVMSFVFV